MTFKVGENVLLSLTTGLAGFDPNMKGEVMWHLNHVMFNPFIALAELCEWTGLLLS